MAFLDHLYLLSRSVCSTSSAFYLLVFLLLLSRLSYLFRIEVEVEVEVGGLVRAGIANQSNS
jgi:hypothetical protein